MIFECTSLVTMLANAPNKHVSVFYSEDSVIFTANVRTIALNNSLAVGANRNVSCLIVCAISPIDNALLGSALLVILI